MQINAVDGAIDAKQPQSIKDLLPYYTVGIRCYFSYMQSIFPSMMPMAKKKKILMYFIRHFYSFSMKATNNSESYYRFVYSLLKYLKSPKTKSAWSVLKLQYTVLDILIKGTTDF